MSKFFIASILTLFNLSINAQTPATLKVDGALMKPITLIEYIKQVQQSNAFLKTRKIAIESSIANEEVLSAPVINPSFTLSKGSFYAQAPYTPLSPLANTYSLSGTIEGFGKQGARAELAAADVARTKIDAHVSTKAVDGDATFAFIDTLRVKLIWQALQAASEKIRTINDTEASQAIENHLNIQRNLANDFKYFTLGMNSFVGQGINQLFDPVGTVDIPIKDFNTSDYSQAALARRNDIISLEAGLKVAEANINLTKKNRRIDLYPSIWYSETAAYSTYSNSASYGMSLTIPIPVNNMYDGPLIQANNNKLQYEIFLNDAKARASIEVNQLLLQYNSAKKRLIEARQYFDDVMKNNTQSTKVIVQQRESQVDLIDAQTNHLKLLVQLMRATGDYNLPNLK